MQILRDRRKTVLQESFDELRSTNKDFGKQLRRHLKMADQQKIYHEEPGAKLGQRGKHLAGNEHP